MRVIKHGKIEKRTCTCKICGAELEYEFADTHIETVTQNYCYNYVSCPDCGFKIPVPFFDEVAEDVDEKEQEKTPNICCETCKFYIPGRDIDGRWCTGCHNYSEWESSYVDKQ